MRKKSLFSLSLVLFFLLGITFLFFLNWGRAQGPDACLCPPTEQEVDQATVAEFNLEEIGGETWNYLTAAYSSIDSMQTQLDGVENAANELRLGLANYLCSNADPNCGNNQTSCPAPAPACLNLSAVEPADFDADTTALRNAADALEQEIRDLEYSTTVQKMAELAQEYSQFQQCQAARDSEQFLYFCGLARYLKLKTSCNFSSVFCISRIPQ